MGAVAVWRKMCADVLFASPKKVPKSRLPTWVVGSVFHITISGEFAALSGNKSLGEENKQISERTHL